MSTTVTLDDNVASKLEEEIRRRGGSLNQAVNDLLREGLQEQRTSSDDFDETSAELMSQIREGHQEYLRGELRPVEEFITELEAEIEDSPQTR